MTQRTPSEKLNYMVDLAVKAGLLVQVEDSHADDPTSFIESYTVWIRVPTRDWDDPQHSMLDVFNRSESIWIHALRVRGHVAAFKISAERHHYRGKSRKLRPTMIQHSISTLALYKAS